MKAFCSKLMVNKEVHAAHDDGRGPLKLLAERSRFIMPVMFIQIPGSRPDKPVELRSNVLIADHDDQDDGSVPFTPTFPLKLSTRMPLAHDDQDEGSGPVKRFDVIRSDDKFVSVDQTEGSVPFSWFCDRSRTPT